MIRNIVAVIVGAILAGGTIGLVQSLNMVLYPPPPGLDYNDPEQIKALMAQMPIGALLVVEVSYGLGCLVGGLFVGKVAASRHFVLAGIVGVLFTLAGFANLAAIPHPLWMAILTTVTYIPASLAGAWIIRRS